jgi:hypothetical protein
MVPCLSRSAGSVSSGATWGGAVNRASTRFAPELSQAANGA